MGLLQRLLRELQVLRGAAPPRHDRVVHYRGNHFRTHCGWPRLLLLLQEPLLRRGARIRLPVLEMELRRELLLLPKAIIGVACSRAQASRPMSPFLRWSQSSAASQGGALVRHVFPFS